MVGDSTTQNRGDTLNRDREDILIALGYEWVECKDCPHQKECLEQGSMAGCFVDVEIVEEEEE